GSHRPRQRKPFLLVVLPFFCFLPSASPIREPAKSILYSWLAERCSRPVSSMPGRVEQLVYRGCRHALHRVRPAVVNLHFAVVFNDSPGREHHAWCLACDLVVHFRLEDGFIAL